MPRCNLREDQWQRLAPLLPPERGRKGRPSKDNRLMLQAMLWIHRTGAPWRDLPPEYGPWKSVYTRFRRWCQQGVWCRVLAHLSQDRDEESRMIDSTITRAHQHAAGGKGGRRLRPLVGAA